MSESLKDEIAKISKETRDTQDRINVIVSIFTKENVDYHSRESAERWHRIPLYDEMTYLERKLGLTQRRFASLMLQSVKGSTDQLDSSVWTLHSSTEILIKSSKRLEYLTSLLFLVAAISVVVSLEAAVLPKDLLLPISILSLVAVGLMLIPYWRLVRRSNFVLRRNMILFRVFAPSYYLGRINRAEAT